VTAPLPSGHNTIAIGDGTTNPSAAQQATPPLANQRRLQQDSCTDVGCVFDAATSPFESAFDGVSDQAKACATAVGITTLAGVGGAAAYLGLRNKVFFKNKVRMVGGR
jgi:hypothetical protein